MKGQENKEANQDVREYMEEAKDSSWEGMVTTLILVIKNVTFSTSFDHDIFNVYIFLQPILPLSRLYYLLINPFMYLLHFT